MAQSTFRISDDLNLDGVTFNLSGATSGQVLTYTSSSTSFVPTTETPVGTIVMYAGSSVPSGWLVCDGGEYSNDTYPALSAALNGKYGSDFGTFFLPNLVSKIPVAMNANTSAPHNTSASSLDTFNHSHTATYGTNGATVSLAHSHTSGGDGAHTHSVTSDDKGTHTHGGATGAGGAHTHTYQTKLSGSATNTSFSDSSHEHGTTSNDATHSHNDAGNSANHTHPASGTTSLSHSHSISSISAPTQNTSVSNHGHGTIAVMQVVFIIKA